ncbi:3-dehydro-L-gulonate 2-dehydrogenase [Mucilaginibacter sp. Bleaf8]|uniref:3-dehydro-L-gulonate 2-dehydrogenase n=1 Tax=Mucilaginibacter sp. Bleaf8 TaxID=2834430 RepID=UPI001BCEB30B|nr:3-dehydro-L-gulonate 2-dehydrogenase [Mucilaginibacter sp. Bleaf8]MBS7563980.1 3-dehydro-L-gulonate 2-dehydrogenase [Mucilaginibacter sp. Bleaf8]
MRISFEQMQAEFKRVLLKNGFAENKANECATIFAENSRDGVYTHGLNRFPVFVQYLKDGLINPDAAPSPDDSMGLLERWDGNLGPGMLNARFCMDRAISLAQQHGMGCVAIRNTNHWMRGGTYGWQAAEAGCIGICFTNTIANLPPWGGIDPRLGNNPLIIAVPRAGGHVVLDMAVSQYSFGKLQQYKASGDELPLPGGYDAEGNLSTNAAHIMESKRLLPVGFWKGSGLSLMLDLLVTVLSNGKSTAAVTQAGAESGISQVFICIKPQDDGHTAGLIEQIVAYTKTSRLVEPEQAIRYPGESTLKTREKNLKEGIPVDEQIWQKVLAL